jgi:hypothetical protein
LHTGDDPRSVRLSTVISNRNPSTDPPADPQTMQEGDIVVTRVAHHYALGRLNADRRTQTPIEAQDHRSAALRRACDLAGADHHVFLYELAGPSNYIDVNCAEAFEPERLNRSVHGERRIKSRKR